MLAATVSLRALCTLMLLAFATGCVHHRQPATAAGPDLTTEAGSLTGRKLERPRFDDPTAARLGTDLALAADSLRARPASADALLWVGRRLAYLGRYRDAIDTFSVGVKRFPMDPRFLRHRGHRYLTVRRPMLAIKDLARAGELVRGIADAIEPDGAPNAQGISVSTLQFNIWYHLGLAHYVQGEWAAALAAYDACARASVNPDLRVATAYWRYLTLRRLHRDAEAMTVLAIAKENPPLLENQVYLKLLRLFASLEPIGAFPLAAGNSVPDATTAYGVSMWHLLNGRRQEAHAMWTQLNTATAWGSFAVLAAEGELAFAR